MSKNMKYYWLVYSYNNAGGGKTWSEEVTWKHPFEYMKEQRDAVSGHGVVVNMALINWKEITQEEYNLWKWAPPDTIS